MNLKLTFCSQRMNDDVRTVCCFSMAHIVLSRIYLFFLLFRRSNIIVDVRPPSSSSNTLHNTVRGGMKHNERALSPSLGLFGNAWRVESCLVSTGYIYIYIYLSVEKTGYLSVENIVYLSFVAAVPSSVRYEQAPHVSYSVERRPVLALACVP